MDGLDRAGFLKAAGAGAVALGLGLGWETPGEAAVSLGALRELARRVRGRVVLPRDAAYGGLAQVYNTRFDGVRPPAVVLPRDVRDVQETVRWGRRHHVGVVARSGGHSYAGYSTSRRAVVVDLRNWRGVHPVDGGRLARVGAGAQLIDVYAALARRGGTVPAGSCPSVGISGVTLGGGMGLAARHLGMSCDRVEAVTIVTADGRARKVDARHEGDLLWASKGGGGGNFGIVCDFTLRPHAVRSAAYFFVSWPFAQAEEALAAWQAFAPHALDRLTSIFSLITGGGGLRVQASGQWFGDAGTLRRLLRPLTRVAGAQLSVGAEDYLALQLRWAGCADESLRACHTRGASAGGTQPRASFYAGSDYVGRALPAAGRRALIGALHDLSRLRSVGSGALLLDSYGGAINRVAPGATAFVHRHELFCIQYLAYRGGPGGTAASRAWVGRSRRSMARWTSGHSYQNYIDPDLRDWPRAYYGSNLGRLRAIKRHYDPDGFFAFPQGVRPT